MSMNPLFEASVWIFSILKNVNSENIKDWIINAPTYYYSWWKTLLQESPQHILIETGLLLFIVWLMFIRKTVDPAKANKNDKLSKKDVEWLIDTWTPDSLVPQLSTKETLLSSNMMVGPIHRVYCFYSSNVLWMLLSPI